MSEPLSPKDDPHEEIAYLKGRVEALMKEQVAPAVGAMAGQAEAIARSARNQVEECRDRVVSYTTEKPLTALGIAVATGFVLAHLCRR